jgi:hypothetical protein
MRSTKSGNPITDPKSAMRLPTCPPPKFSGANVDYIPWKRTWEVTMGKSYMEEVQLMQLKSSIPARTSDLIGLTDLRSMMDFWRHMDEEYLDYHALSRSAIADVKSLDRKDSRFLQMMQVKLNNHRKNLDTNNMGHRITSDEMVNEHWVPLLTEMAKEDWIKRPMREPPLWPHFEAFLETQSQACRERERLGFATPETQAGGAPTHDCTRCMSKYHNKL